MTRVCVRGLSAQTSPEDVRALFSKVGVVEEVYFPGPTLTGLRRDFAIVAVNGDDEALKKYIKSLNGSLWKGSKLSIEAANEWYKDRLQKEWQQQSTTTDNEATEEESQAPPLPAFSSNLFRIRRRKLQEVPTTISLVPRLVVSGKQYNLKQPKHATPCGVKIVFDESILQSVDLPSLEEAAEPEKAPVLEKTVETVAPVVSACESVKPAQAAPNPMAEIVQKLNAGAIQAIGGGVRRGFGTLTVPSEAVVKKAVDGAAGAGAGSGTGGGQGGAGSGGKRGVDCCIEEQEDFNANHLLDDDDSDDGIPCIAEEELQQEALDRERFRALDVLEKLLAGELPERKTLRKEAQEKKKVSFSAAPDAATATATASVSPGDDAPGQHQIVEGQVVSTLTSEAEETLAILNELKGLGNAAPVADAQRSLTTTTDAPEDKKESKGLTEERSAAEEDVLATKDGYANMHQLKDIFYREGGVWWGDDGTLKGAVAKGAAAADPLFLEAEKRGIDIRTLTKSKAPAAAALSTEGGSADAQGGGGIFNFSFSAATTAETPAQTPSTDLAGSGGMIFGFFAEPETSAAVVTAPEPSSAKASNTAKEPATALNVKQQVAPAAVKGGPAGGDKPPSRPVVVELSAAELVAMARKFSREKPVDVLTSEWRDGRDKLVLDYKRKRRDMKRRTAAWSTAHPSITADGTRERPPATSSSTGAGAGAGAGGARSGPQFHHKRGRGRGGAGARKKARST